jgi:hypothetical protein
MRADELLLVILVKLSVESAIRDHDIRLHLQDEP